MASKPQSSVEEFFQTANERERIRIRKAQGVPREGWTEDKAFQTYYFCNVFREDDKTTAWLRENIRSKVRGKVRTVQAVAGFRWFNKIETGELIAPVLKKYGWDSKLIKAALKGHENPFTGAYIIMPKPGVSQKKLAAVCDVMDCLDADVVIRLAQKEKSLEAAWIGLMQSPGMGPFMAYEVITDLFYTPVLSHAQDSLTWANPGPGAMRGLKWIFPKITRLGMITEMRNLLALSDEMFEHDRPWDMRTVEHWLCEHDKWCRATKLGQRQKRRY